MARSKQACFLEGSSGQAVAAMAAVFLLTVLAASAQAQTFQVLHTFTDGADGANPYAGLAIDQGGNLYGTADAGGYKGGSCGSAGCGTVFKLSHHGSGWIFSPLYEFQGGDDGTDPSANVVIGPDGSLYSTTSQGGTANAGTVFRLQPPVTICRSSLCYWTKTEIYQFTGVPNGGLPRGTLLFDQSGDIYGVTEDGGTGNQGGVVYKLTHSSEGWTQSIIYGEVGGSPMSGVVLDDSGNLYGTTLIGGGGYGSVYQLAPSGSGWILNTLTNFEQDGDGNEPIGGVILDAAGNLYGGTSGGGNNGGGTIFEMTDSGGNWTMTNLYELGPGVFGVVASLTMDAAGNLYGATYDEGTHGYGNVFKLTPSDGGWIYTDLYDFTGGIDGAYPGGNVTLDANGNIYGTAGNGGAQQCHGFYNGCGTVWEITP